MSRMDEQRAFLEANLHHADRRELTEAQWKQISAEIQNPALALDMRAALRLRRFLENERIVRRGERIPAWRTLKSFPDIYAEGEKERLQQGKYIHEQGRVCNISSDWAGVLTGGLLHRKTGDEARDLCIEAVLVYADRYEDEALSRALREGAKTYPEALKMFRILHFCLWASNVYHNTVGRFDQYMWPFLKADLESGLLSEASALEWTEEFFLSFNRDSDLYTGMQQGDNGQSLMLGGVTRSGECAVNLLTELALKASLHNRRIDPKINLRVDKNTPIELYRLATGLTKQGLGFPQYANDDVVIPGLTALGYDIEDARDYTVAACWEFIIPGVGMDIPNIGAVALAGVVSECVEKHLTECSSYAAFFDKVKEALKLRAQAIAENVRNLWMEPAPYQSVLMSDFTHDVSEGAKYNNYGVHGTGFGEAVDQLAVIREEVYGGTLDANELLAAMHTDFADAHALRRRLRTISPKLGRDPVCEEIGNELLAAFADALQPLRNEQNGIFRAGTGSAMYYLWHADDLPTLCSGHMKGERLPANFSPSLLLKDAGPLSVIRAMALPEVRRAINGGPLTLELHDTVFRNQEGAEKVAQLVRSFIQLGGHQLQLNAVSRETLQAAMERPDEHRSLIVRVWGWSGHFVQLDRAYQEQIMERVSYQSV